MTRPISSSSSKSLTIKIPPATPSGASKVHPLEALYKRVKGAEGSAISATPQESQPFSFFGAGAPDADDEEVGVPIQTPMGAPMTPFTREEFEWRNLRSAAPTPDTAHPTRMRHFWASSQGTNDDEMEGVQRGAVDDVMPSTETIVEEDEGADEQDDEDQGMDGVEEEDEDDDDDDAAAPPQNGPSGSTDFQKWFWENRRDLNGSWMKRRKTAAKEKRHRDNKARASKAM
jgi:hypothetical protein